MSNIPRFIILRVSSRFGNNLEKKVLFEAPFREHSCQKVFFNLCL